MTISAIAMKLAIEAKSCGLEHDLVSVCVDGGFSTHYDMPRDANMFDANVLSDEAFEALVDEVEAALPHAKFNRRIAADWSRAGQDFGAAAAFERRASGGDA